MKAITTFCALFGSALAAPSWKSELTVEDFAELSLFNEFMAWKQEFEVSYASPKEDFTRFGIWVENLRRIAKANTKQTGSLRLAGNQFLGWTDEEFSKHMFGDNGACSIPDEHRPQFVIGRPQEDGGAEDPGFLGSSMNWNSKGCVTPVKDQKSCGSCWAFSAVASIECNYAIKESGGGSCSSMPKSLSEQQIVDCDENDHGCNGGLPSRAFEYVQQAGGLCTETEYPYTAKNGKCEASTCGKKYDHVQGEHSVTKDSSSSLQSAVNKGCVSVSVEADQLAFQYYSSGVLDGTCGTNTDHAITVVGYGAESNGEEYWLCKNSWGTSWGEKGYVKICKDCGKNGSKGECGILTGPSYPTF